MTPRTVLGAIAIAFLVVTPFFGFAAGETPRELGSHHGTTTQVVWKTMPATTPPPVPIPRLPLLERLAPVDSRLPTLPASRPPFVPPRG